MKNYLELLRVEDYYKNITVVLGFTLALFIFNVNLNYNLFFSLVLVLFLSFLVSSSNYILNSITDVKYDFKHPIKRLRPLPSKAISLKKAYYLMVFLVVISLFFSYILFNLYVFLTLLLLFIAAVLYNIKPIRFKDRIYLDVLSESINNPIRFLIGWFVITFSFPSFFLLLLIWSLGCVLMSVKRFVELKKFGKILYDYRIVYRKYSLRSLRISIWFYVILSFVLGVFVIY
jgi:decaprenyl-phosphate phosphoribosyltransferase